jgi:hypothetical protein
MNSGVFEKIPIYSFAREQIYLTTMTHPVDQSALCFDRSTTCFDRYLVELAILLTDLASNKKDPIHRTLRFYWQVPTGSSQDTKLSMSLRKL